MTSCEIRGKQSFLVCWDPGARSPSEPCAGLWRSLPVPGPRAVRGFRFRHDDSQVVIVHPLFHVDIPIWSTDLGGRPE